MIHRNFADVASRQVHFRRAGEGPTLVMLHASPGSSKQLEAAIAALSRTRGVIAPDTPGNGDSTPLDNPAPRIADYAAALIEFLDAIGVERCDLYGSHTGANIALEVAIQAPGRVGKVILDGIGLYSDAERDIYLAHYCPPITPDLIGSHLLKTFMFCRDQYLFWPWFETGAAHRRAGGLPSAASLNDWVVEVLKSITTYHLGYRAAFQHPALDRLPLVTGEVMLMAAENDPLRADTERAAALVPRGRFRPLGPFGSAGFTEALAALVEAYLSEPGPAPD